MELRLFEENQAQHALFLTGGNDGARNEVKAAGQSRYLDSIKKAKMRRDVERELVLQKQSRRDQKEDEEVFVTSAYRAKLAEMKSMEDEIKQQDEEDLRKRESAGGGVGLHRHLLKLENAGEKKARVEKKLEEEAAELKMRIEERREFEEQKKAAVERAKRRSRSPSPGILRGGSRSRSASPAGLRLGLS